MQLHRLLSMLCVGVGDPELWAGGTAGRLQREREAVKAGLTAMVEEAFFAVGEQMALSSLEAWATGEPRLSRWLTRFGNDCTDLIKSLAAQLPAR